MSEKVDLVLDALAEIGVVARGNIREEMDLVADLGIDSPKALRLLVEMEEALGLEISDEDAAAMVTVADILAYMRDHG